MNLFSTFPLMITAILSFFIDNLYAATVIQLIQRDAVTGQDIADTFNQINATIATGLQEAQQSVTQAGPPDFSMATAGLSALSLLAKKADGQLNQLGQDVPLDEGSSQMIYSYLNSSASSVAQLAELVKEGKPFFEKLHDTNKVVEILQTAGYQTTNLFTDLNKHISQQDDDMFDRAEGVFLCSIVNAASTLNSNKVSNEAVNKCSSDAANNYATFEPSDFQGLFPFPPFAGL